MARVLRVAQKEAVDGEQERREEADGSPEQSGSQRMDRRDRGDGADDREAADRGLGLSEMEPGAEEQSVEPHVRVPVARGGQEIGPALACVGRAQRLVEPETRRAQVPARQHRGERGNSREFQRRDAPLEPVFA